MTEIAELWKRAELTREQELRVSRIADQAHVQAQYYENHSPKSDEIIGRKYLEEIQFLLGTIRLPQGAGEGVMKRIVYALALLLTACAMPPPSHPLPAGHPAPPIGGWVDFCMRNPMDPLCPHP